MSSRKNADASILRVIKRRLGRYNIDLLRAQKPEAKVVAHGGYKLRDAATGKIVFGDKGYEFSASLEDVEAWLDAREGNNR